MNNIEKYNEIFVKTFEVDKDALSSLEYGSVKAWDSVGQVVLLSAIEDNFGIILEMEDMMEFSSYEKGIEILKKYGIEFEH